MDAWLSTCVSVYEQDLTRQSTLPWTYEAGRLRRTWLVLASGLVWYGKYLSHRGGRCRYPEIRAPRHNPSIALICRGQIYSVASSMRGTRRFDLSHVKNVLI